MSANAPYVGSVAVKPFMFGGSLKKLGKRREFDVVLASDVLGCGDASLYPDLVSSHLVSMA